MTFYIIPGFGESTNDIGYKNIIDYIQKKGFEVLPFNPVWERKTIKDWLKSFNEFIEKNNKKDVVVLGFSFGAYIAVLSAKNHKFNQLILCSLSPYFKENIKNLPPLAHKILGKKRMEYFAQYEFPVDVNVPSVFLVGDKDLPLVIAGVKSFYEKWNGTKQIEILKNVEHDINNDFYFNSLKKYI